MSVSPLLLIISALAASPGVDLGATPAGPDAGSRASAMEIPLEGPYPSTPERSASALPPDGAAPLSGDALEARARDEPTPVIAKPFGDNATPTARASDPVDPKTTRIVRVDFTTGTIWRVREVDPMVMTSVEVGAMRGFSASFHTGMIVGINTDNRDFFRSDPVRGFDFPIGFGALARGRLRNRPLYASVGLTAGILVHRATVPRTEDREGTQVVRRVDPDFRLPIRFAWTIAGVGITVALEQGYSVRTRSYELRGSEVWARSAYRIGFVIGLHCDTVVGRTMWSRSERRGRSNR